MAIYDKAIEYFHKALIIDKKENKLNKMAIRLNSIGLVYKNIEKYDSAILYLNKALNIDKKLGNQKEIAIRLSNLGGVYTQIDRFDKAEKLFKDAISIFKELKINYSLCISYNELADLYLQKKEYLLAERYSKESLEIAKNIQLNNITKENYKRISKIYEIKYFTGQLKQSSGTVYEFLDNLLQWAKSQLGGIKPQMLNLNLKTLVDNVIKNNKSIADNKNILLINTINKDIELKTDKNILAIILRNLITNGIKFTGKDGKVIISAEGMDGRLKIKIEDTGIGISKEDIKKLFRIDVNTKTIGTSQEKGSGLGLILCNELAEKINGRISVESTINKGSVFIIDLS